MFLCHSYQIARWPLLKNKVTNIVRPKAVGRGSLGSPLKVPSTWVIGNARAEGLVPGLPLNSSMVLDKLFNLPEPQFLHHEHFPNMCSKEY